MNDDAISIKGYAQVSLAISSTGAQTAALARGLYDVWTDSDCFIKVDTTASDVTTATGYKLFANNIITVAIGQGDKLGAITSAASSNLHLHRVGDM